MENELEKVLESKFFCPSRFAQEIENNVNHHLRGGIVNFSFSGGLCLHIRNNGANQGPNTKLIAEARATVDDRKRAELIKKGVKLVYEEVPTIPIPFRHITSAV
jgi:hypothetical protein